MTGRYFMHGPRRYKTTGKKKFFIFNFFEKTKKWSSFQAKIRHSCKLQENRPKKMAFGINGLKEMVDNFNLVDPFRALYPNKMAFSYRPFGTQRKNMSRIDFFLVSSSLLEKICDSDIFSAHISSAFDHKPVTLHFKDKNKLNHEFKNKQKIITNWFLDERLIKMSVELSALRRRARCFS
jgi:hypothetical protein